MVAGSFRTGWRKISISTDASLLQAMAVISDGKMGIALVVDDEDSLRGTLTDGDLRRAILNGAQLDTPSKTIMEGNPFCVTPDTPLEEVVEGLRSRSIRQAPVCESGRVVGMYLLEELLGAGTRGNWVLVMAGGEGRRLWPLTAYVPKPLLPIGRQPILEQMISHLRLHGFREIFIAVRHLGQQIVDDFGDGRHIGANIRYIREGEALGTAGALGLLPGVPDQPLVLINGDLITDVDLGDLLAFHEAHGARATVCVSELHYEIPYGVVECVGERVVRLDEKPSHRELVNTGIYVFDPEVVEEVRGEAFLPATSLLVKLLQRDENDVRAYRLKDTWKDVGQFADYERVRARAERQEDP